jgi:hypothetical protein
MWLSIAASTNTLYAFLLEKYAIPLIATLKWKSVKNIKLKTNISDIVTSDIQTNLKQTLLCL